MKELVLSRRDLLVRIAKMYYEQELSQSEIAKNVNISRSNVSRMLRLCRELKIVDIRIDETSSMGILLEAEILQLFHLKKVVVVPSIDDQEQLKVKLGQAAARLLESQLADGMSVGISWGSSLYYLVENFLSSRRINVSVVQLLGGQGARNLNIDGYELARKMAAKLSGTCYVLQAPLIVQNELLRDMLMKEPDICQIIERAKQVDIAVLGIGTIHPGNSALMRAGYIDVSTLGDLKRLGVVGDILGYQMYADGRIFEHEMNRRIISIKPEDLIQIPTTIGVAGGVHKAAAIRAAIEGEYINTLVTDEWAAMHILSAAKENRIK